MNTYHVFDFDGTIYGGDSSKDFFFFALKRHPTILRIIPCFLYRAVLYGMKRCSKERLKEGFFSFLKYIPDTAQEVRLFWATHGRKIYPWYCGREHSADIIVSASPGFLVAPVMREYQVAAVLATNVDPSTGHFLGRNCYGQEKVERLVGQFPDCVIESFYSDSTSDLPLARLAKQAYFVVNGEVRPWQDAAQ